MLVQLLFTFILVFNGLWAQTPPLPPPPNQPLPLPAPPELPRPEDPAALPAELPAAAPVEPGSEIAVKLDDPSLEKKPTGRDPFARPKSFTDRLEEEKKPVIDPSVYIDHRIEAIRRFPIRNYVLVGIIFDVEKPKAMVKDPENNMHMLTTDQRIGNQEGRILKIEKGEMIIDENGKVITLKLQK